MSNSDSDDMPPPLEDMTEQIKYNKEKIQQAMGKGGIGDMPMTEDHTEEIRLAPKKPKQQTGGTTTSGGIAPKEDNFDFDSKAKASQQASAPDQNTNTVNTQDPPAKKPAAAPQKKKKDQGFGGFAAGFLSGPPQKKKKPQAQTQAKKAEPAPKKVELEDQTHIKAKTKDDQLKFEEVQAAMNTNYDQAKQDWLTPEFFEKLAKNPKLLKAFQNPQFMKIFEEFGKNPKECMAKYGSNPEFREIMEEFSGFMGDHFGTVADKKAAEAEQQRKEQEEQLKSDPVYQTIQTDPQVQEYLNDPEVQEIVQHLRFKGGMDLHEIMREKPQVGQKMMFLINKGVFNTQSQL